MLTTYRQGRSSGKPHGPRNTWGSSASYIRFDYEPMPIPSAFREARHGSGRDGSPAADLLIALLIVAACGSSVSDSLGPSAQGDAIPTPTPVAIVTSTPAVIPSATPTATPIPTPLATPVPILAAWREAPAQRSVSGVRFQVSGPGRGSWPPATASMTRVSSLTRATASPGTGKRRMAPAWPRSGSPRGRTGWLRSAR